MGTFQTPGGVTLPDDADLVTDGAARIRDVGYALDPPWTLFSPAVGWVARPEYPPQWRKSAGVVHFAGAVSASATTWDGSASMVFQVLDANPNISDTGGAPLIQFAVVFCSPADPGVFRSGMLHVEPTGAVYAYAPATPATATWVSLEGLRWVVAAPAAIPEIA